MLASGDLVEDASEYPGRMLVLCGSRDVVTPPADVRQVAQSFSQATYTEIPGAGHASYVEDPAQFNRAVYSFVKQMIEKSKGNCGQRQQR